MIESALETLFGKYFRGAAQPSRRCSDRAGRVMVSIVFYQGPRKFTPRFLSPSVFVVFAFFGRVTQSGLVWC